MPDRSGKIKKSASTDYGKVASAVNFIKSAGIKFTLLDINKSNFNFVPDEENNQIIYGLKPVTNITDEFIDKIINNRPYKSMWDFIDKVNPNKSQMTALIKGGAFDEFGERRILMGEYIYYKMDKKKQITMASINTLLKEGLLTLTKEQELNYRFHKYLNQYCKKDNCYILNDSSLEFYSQFYDMSHLTLEDGIYKISKSKWTKLYNEQMFELKQWLADNKQNLLDALNKKIFFEEYKKYGEGSISKWEMDSLCFYYHQHELANINIDKYGISSFNKLPEDPIIDHFFSKGRNQIPIYQLNFICGTVLSKDKSKGTIALLTHDGTVVTVKMRKEHFAYFDKQISEVQEDGKKKVIEKSWFKKGNLLVLQGIRRGRNFTTKKYAGTHQLYKIESIDSDGNITMIGERSA